MGLGLVATHPGIVLGRLTLARLDERIAVNVSLPLAAGPQENSVTVYSADGPQQLSGVTVLPCGPPASDVPDPWRTSAVTRRVEALPLTKVARDRPERRSGRRTSVADVNGIWLAATSTTRADDAMR